MVDVLNTFGFGATGISAQLFLQPNKIIRMGNPPLRIEILTSISGVDFATAFADRVSDFIDGVPVKIISRQQLILNKQASGRLKDLSDLEHL